MQGLGVGGEWGGAVLLALEYSQGGRRGFAASWPQAGVPLGLLASTGAMAACKATMSPADFLAWGWRLPFFLSGVLIGVGLLIRMRIPETPLFAALQQKNEVAEAPVRETVRRHWRVILLAGGIRVVENASFYVFTASAIFYAEKVLFRDSGAVLAAINVAAGVEFFTIPLYGWLSDKISRRAAYMAGCVFLMLWAMPYYAMFLTGEPAWIMLGTVVALAGGHALLYAMQASLIPELFGTRLRCTGASLGYQLVTPLAGGVAPLIAAVLMKFHREDYWPLVAYIGGLGTISLICVWLLSETASKELER
jgi:MFS family permease